MSIVSKLTGLDTDELDIPALIGKIDALESTMAAILVAAERSAAATEALVEAART